MKANEVFDQVVLLKQILESKKRAEFGDDFFSFEKLPIGRKEYWFLYFTSTTGSLQQLVLTFGKSNPLATVNENKKPTAKEHSLFGWFYDNRKKTFVSTNAEMTAVTKRRRLDGRWKNGGFKFEKKNRNHEFSVKNVCRLRLSTPENGPAQESYKRLSIPKTSIGASLSNAYFDAEGVLNKKRFKGKAYVQKVVITAPFVPWDWGRITFRDGSILKFFVVKIGVGRATKELYSKAAFYYAGKNKTIEFNNIKLTKKPGFFNVTTKNRDFSLNAKTYAKTPFTMQSIGAFSYNEYLIKTTGFSLPAKNIELNDLGGGIGLIEQARGYML